jgi:hypothetical protein
MSPRNAIVVWGFEAVWPIAAQRQPIPLIQNPASFAIDKDRRAIFCEQNHTERQPFHRRHRCADLELERREAAVQLTRLLLRDHGLRRGEQFVERAGTSSIVSVTSE